MMYILMCGGDYDKFDTPKQLYKVNGERIVDRTIRLLKEYGIDKVYISSNNPLFDTCDAIRLENKKNTYRLTKYGNKGNWLDAYYPVEEPVCYLYGDVYYSENAIETIVNHKSNKNILFGSEAAKNVFHQNWGEPFAFKVNDYKTFFQGIKDVLVLKEKGLINREPVSWELYRYLNGLDINIQRVLDDTYVVIEDGTIDIDSPDDIERLGKFKEE